MAGETGGISRTHSMPHTISPSDEASENKSPSTRARSSLTTNTALEGLKPKPDSLSPGHTSTGSSPRILNANLPGPSNPGVKSQNTSRRHNEIRTATPSESGSENGRTFTPPSGSTSLRRSMGAPVFTPNSPFNDIAIEIEFAQPPPPASSWRAMAATPLNALSSFGGNALSSLKSGTEKIKGGAIIASKFAGKQMGAGLEKGKELSAAGAAKGKQAAIFVGSQAGQVGTSVASGLGVMGIEKKFAGATAGHLIHQTVAVGVPTFLRECMNEVLFAGLRQIPHEHAVALQIVSGTVSLCLHRVRQYREQRSPETAARGFHNLSAEQWAALPAEDQQTKMTQQRRYSDAVTTLATGGILANIALGVAGPHIGQPELAAKLVASDIKVLAYAGARDTIQATFRMVGTEADTNGGVSGTHMDVSGEFYAKVNIAANYAFSAFVPAALSDARLTLAGQHSPLSKHEAMNVVYHSSAVKAAINTVLETADWTNVTEQEAKEAGTSQKFDPAWKGKRQDYMSVLDKSIARTAAINSNIAASNVLSVIGERVGLSPAATSLLSNGGSGAMAGLSYKVIGGTWQAEGAVRTEKDSRPETAG